MPNIVGAAMCPVPSFGATSEYDSSVAGPSSSLPLPRHTVTPARVPGGGGAYERRSHRSTQPPHPAPGRMEPGWPHRSFLRMPWVLNPPHPCVAAQVTWHAVTFAASQLPRSYWEPSQSAPGKSHQKPEPLTSATERCSARRAGTGAPEGGRILSANRVNAPWTMVLVAHSGAQPGLGSHEKLNVERIVAVEFGPPVSVRLAGSGQGVAADATEQATSSTPATRRDILHQFFAQPSWGSGFS